MADSEDERPDYKPTLFDRHGPAAVHIVRAWGYGLMVFGLAMGAFSFRGVMSVWTVLFSALLGACTGGLGYGLGHLAGEGWKTVFVKGATTPYKEQYSYQQALVMQGRVDEALESFEAIIATSPANIDVRLKAAELYVREKKNAVRAAELFREVQRTPTVRAREDIYVTNRLVDLLTGPLADPGRALVELRRLIERYPNTAAATHAREALARLKQGPLPDG